MEIKIILLFGDRLVKIISQQSTGPTAINKYIDESNILNDNEKEQYFYFLNLFNIFKYVHIDDEITEIFVNPVHSNMKVLNTANYNYCKIFNYDEDAILKFTNNLLYFDHGNLFLFFSIIHTEYYKSKVRTECPICYNKTLCFKFFKCNHVICSNCYLQLDKVNCIYRCNT
jgi:hypothetical protein